MWPSCESRPFEDHLDVAGLKRQKEQIIQISNILTLSPAKEKIQNILAGKVNVLSLKKCLEFGVSWCKTKICVLFLIYFGETHWVDPGVCLYFLLLTIFPSFRLFWHSKLDGVLVRALCFIASKPLFIFMGERVLISRVFLRSPAFCFFKLSNWSCGLISIHLVIGFAR